MAAVQEHFGFTHKSDNVVDAYVLAKIATNLFFVQETASFSGMNYQSEVIEAILNPKTKAKKKKVRSK